MCNVSAVSHAYFMGVFDLGVVDVDRDRREALVGEPLGIVQVHHAATSGMASREVGGTPTLFIDGTSTAERTRREDRRLKSPTTRLP